MINEIDRAALILYRLQQAEETYELARFLAESKKFTISVNRIYYGMYYALTALAIKNNFETSKHAQLIGWFNKNFVALNKVERKYGRILRNAYQNRTKGDYDAFVSFTVQEVDELLVEMYDFICEIKKICRTMN